MVVSKKPIKHINGFRDFRDFGGQAPSDLDRFRRICCCGVTSVFSFFWLMIYLTTSNYGTKSRIPEPNYLSSQTPNLQLLAYEAHPRQQHPFWTKDFRC